MVVHAVTCIRNGDMNQTGARLWKIICQNENHTFYLQGNQGPLKNSNQH